MKALTIDEFKSYIDNGYEVVDFRHPNHFLAGFVPNSFYLNPQDENALVIYNQFIKPFNKAVAIFPTDLDRSIDSIVQNIDVLEISGYLKGGFESWKNNQDQYDMLITIDADEFEMDIKHDKEIELMDVRKTKDFEQEHLEDAVSAPLEQIPLLVGELHQTEKFYILSNSLATSIAVGAYLNRHGLTLIRVLNGTFSQMKNTSLPIAKKKKKE